MEAARKMSRSLLALRDEHSFSDVVVVVDGKEFYCHRIILAAASDFFKAALKSDMVEGQQKRITLQDMSVDTFSTLLTWMYSGKNALTEENIFDVWEAADMLQIKFIIPQCLSVCEKIFDTNLRENNCVEYLSEVRLLDEQAKLRVMSYIYKQFSSLDIQSQAKKFKEDEVKYLVAREGLMLYSEDDVVEFVLRWAVEREDFILIGPPEKDLGSKSSGGKTPNYLSGRRSPPASSLAEILQGSRYLCISQGCLHGILANHPLVKADLRCQELVKKIALYKARPHVHRSYCPPAAIHREHCPVTNVLLMCQLQNGEKLTWFDLKNMEWKQSTLVKLISWKPKATLMYYDQGIYVAGDTLIAKYLPKQRQWQSDPLPIFEGIIRIFNDSLFIYTKSKATSKVWRHKLLNFPQFFDKDLFQDKSLGGIPTGWGRDY